MLAGFLIMLGGTNSLIIKQPTSKYNFRYSKLAHGKNMIVCFATLFYTLRYLQISIHIVIK